MVFEELVGAKAPVWKYGKYDKVKERAKCNICEKEFVAKARSTTALIRHLKFVHKIEVNASIDTDSTTPKKRKMESMDMFVTGKKKKASLNEVIARLCAHDLLSYKVISASITLRQAFKSDGYQLPQSHSTVRISMLNYYEEIKAKIKLEIASKIQDGHRFSASADEYTSSKNRRYLNINLHYVGEF